MNPVFKILVRTLAAGVDGVSVRGPFSAGLVPSICRFRGASSTEFRAI